MQKETISEVTSEKELIKMNVCLNIFEYFCKYVTCLKYIVGMNDTILMYPSVDVTDGNVGIVKT